ncbi:MAG: DUF4230 domain-containing protein [Bacteroidales bacterium]|nr:DUF4230 domain-containing protein [Bacteroidales bacterium]
MKEKRFSITVGPSVILFAAIILAAILLIVYAGNRQKRGRTITIDDTPVIATRIRALGELTTAGFYDEIVISGSKRNTFSSSTLGIIAKDGLGKDWDDHLVIIARGTVRAGIDLASMSDGDISFSGDTVVIRLPEPQYLDVIVNPSDFEIFAESGKWSQGQISTLQNNARRKLLVEADNAGLKETAYEGAMEAVTDLMAACGYTFIRFEQSSQPLILPGRESGL